MSASASQCVSSVGPGEIQRTSRTLQGLLSEPPPQLETFISFFRKTKPAVEAPEKINLSFESEQQQQQGCLQTTPKIFRFSKDRNRNLQQSQRLPLAAIKQRRAADNENQVKTETNVAEEERGWRNIEIKRTEEATGQINQAFQRDSAVVVKEQGNSPISTGELKEKVTNPVKDENRTKKATQSTFTSGNTDKVAAGIILEFSHLSAV